MTEKQLEKRMDILNNLLSAQREKYTIRLDRSFISIRNNSTKEGIYTDSLQAAKRWLVKDMKAQEVIKQNA